MILPRASIDIEERIAYFETVASDAVADRFRAEVAASIAELANFPLRGASRTVGAPLLRGLRSWPVRGIANILLFYRVTEESIDIIRVLHGMQDLKDASFT